MQARFDPLGIPFSLDFRGIFPPRARWLPILHWESKGHTRQKNKAFLRGLLGDTDGQYCTYIIYGLISWGGLALGGP